MNSLPYYRQLGAGISVIALCAGWTVAARAEDYPDLKRLSIEELANLEVSSVSRTPEPVSGAPAAIYVITGEDVRRSGHTSLPEVLRLAPNLQVARIDAGDYAISARGFTSGISNKLLVLIDGRTVYTPLYSGVYWDMQAVPPSDIERIEVISGPGGALWGSNAVNGVINVVTRNAADMPGALVRASGGNTDWTGTAQYSGLLGASGAYRIYGMTSRAGHTLQGVGPQKGTSGGDSLRNAQGGFRSDWTLEDSTLTVQGDLYDGLNRPSTAAAIDINGANILARWRTSFTGESDLEIQAYYDYSARRIRGGIHDSLDIYDVSAQHSFGLGERQSIVWGGGYRVSTDKLTPGANTSFLTPGERTLQLANVFVHDTIALAPRVKLALGLKLESNSYTGIEYMPDARLTWQVTPGAALWAAVSRATRTPSRFDRDLFNRGILQGGPDFQSEELMAYEIGSRARFGDAATLSVSVFYNDYNRLRTAELPFPLTVKNMMYGHSYGIESWATFELTDWWRLKAGGVAMKKVLKLEPGSRSFFGITTEGNDPDHQVSLRSEMNLAADVELDTALRVVGSLPNPRVPAYAALDARLGWNVVNGVQLSLAGYNLTNARHTEFVASSPPRRDVRRSVYATVRWSY